MEIALVAIASLVAGFFAGRWHVQSKHAVTTSRLETLTQQVAEHAGLREAYELEVRELRDRATALATTLEHEREMATQRLVDDQRLVTEFERVSKAALSETREQLEKSAEGSLKLAHERAKSELSQQRMGIEHLVKPVQDNLVKLEQHIAASERARKEEYGGLFQQMQDVAATNNRIQKEASDLKNVLRSSSATRGRWGEVQLRRVVELAGMSGHCDFTEQSFVSNEDGGARADLLVHLPNETTVAVDAKVPYDAYEQAQTCDDPAKAKLFLADHAKHFKMHVDSLAKRSYWEKYSPTCGFAVLFVPGDSLLDAALAHDGRLWEYAAEKHILLATPSTLIALLRMTALGWRQQAQAENAVEITRVGKELYKRLTTAGLHMSKVGRGLSQAVGSYNEFVGSMESRVMPSAKKLSELGAGDGELAELTDITHSTRAVKREVFVTEIDGGDDIAGLPEPKRNYG